MQISLGAAQLDVEAVLVKQRILLKSIPRGTAKIVFTARDFGNFLAHPLMRKAASTAIQVGLMNHGDHLSYLSFPRLIVLPTSVLFSYLRCLCTTQWRCWQSVLKTCLS